MTVFLNIDYDFDNEAITSPFFSPMKVPYGFNLNPDKWTVETKVTSDQDKSSGIVGGTWYNVGSNSIVVPIGRWNVSYEVFVQAQDDDQETIQMDITLSDANNSESDPELTFSYRQFADHASLAAFYPRITAQKSQLMNLGSADTFYLNLKMNTAGDKLLLRGTEIPTIIRAVCAEL